ncbi:MAG: RHS repeat-associated core domain-containing protein [bacterium]
MLPLFLALGMCALGAGVAHGQAKPMTVTSFNGMTFDGSGTDGYCWSDDDCEEWTVRYYHLNFTVVSNGQAPFLWVAPSCGSYCSPGANPVGSRGALGSGQSKTISVYLKVPDYASGALSVGLSVAGAVGTGYAYNPSTGTIDPTGYAPSDPWDSYTVTVNITAGVASMPPTLIDYKPSVTPKASTETVPFGAPLSRTFTVQNVGTQSASYALTATCGTMSGCTPSKTTTTLAPGATDAISVGFTTPSTTSASNTISLIARYTNVSSQSIADTGSRPTVTPAFRPSVSPKNGTVIATSDGSGSATFEVSNNGALSDAYVFTPVCQGWAINCVVANTTIPTDPGNAYSVTVRFQTPAAIGNPTYPTATVRLIAQLGPAADTGWVPVALGYYKPVVSPKTSTATDPASTSRSVSVSVRNGGNLPGTYAAVAECAGVTGCALPWGSSTGVLAPGASGTLTFAYTSPPIGQNGTARVIVFRQSANPAFTEADTAVVNIVGADVFPPTIQLTAPTPNEGVIIFGGAVTAPAYLCDAEGQLAAPTATFNGVAVTTTFTAGTGVGCASTKTGTYALLARPGANALVLSASDGYHTTTVTRHFQYDESYEVTPTVTARVASELLRGGQAWADTFDVRNPGPIAVAYALTAYCASGFTSCNASQSSITVGAGQTAKAWVSYVTATTSSVSSVGIKADYTGSSGRTATSDWVYTQLLLDRFAPTATITAPSANSTIGALPDINVQWCDTDGALVGHTVTIDGVSLPANYTSQTQAGCATAGASTWPTWAIALGTHTISATATDQAGHSTTSAVAFTFALPPVGDFQPRVTPRVTTALLVPNDQRIAFAVRNAGTRNALYHLTPACGAVVVAGSCAVSTPALSLAPGATDSAYVSFSIAGIPSASTTLALIASYQDVAGHVSADTGRMNGQVPSIAQLYQPFVSAAGSYMVKPNDNVQMIYAFAFPVQNTGIAPVTYHIHLAITNDAYGFLPWALPDTLLTVNPGETQYAMVEPLLPAGTRVWADIAYTASYTSPNNVTVSSTGHGYIVPGIAIYGVDVGPKNQTRSALPPQVDFVVRATGNMSFGGIATVACTGSVTSCKSGGLQSRAVSISGAPAVVTVDYVTDSTRGPTGTVTLSVVGEVPFTQYGSSATYSIVPGSQYFAVDVSPNAIQLPVAKGATIVQPFEITNTGTQASQFDFMYGCGGAASCSLTSDRTALLAHGQKQTVKVTYQTADALGLHGFVGLLAMSTTASYARDTSIITITTDQLPPIAVHTAGVNSGPNITRSQCLTIAAADDAAYECGDLRLSHALPATTTMNKSRAPMLVYNSAHAAARGIVTANVVVAMGTYPTSLHATLQFVASGKTVDRDIPWNPDFSDAHDRRIAIQFDARALGLTTPDQPVGAFAYKLFVYSGDNHSQFGSDTGTVVVIDRTSSIFGKGWWLDGLEQLSFVTPDANHLLWVGGDGTSRLYTKQSATFWCVTPALDRVDSLMLEGSSYVRHLPNGARVEFNLAGRDTATVNTQLHRTRFHWSTALDKLDSIVLPAPSSAANLRRTYKLDYFAPGGVLPWRLHVVTSPSGSTLRQTTLTYTTAPGGSTVVSSIADPDHSAVTFGFDAAERVGSRVDRRQKTTTFAYDEANGLRQSTVIVSPENIVRTFCAAETAGLTACAPAGTDTATLMAWFDGPRNDVPDTTRFRVTRFGAPSLIVSATKDTTRIERGDMNWPLLVTKTVDVRGHLVSAMYDSYRGLLNTTTDVNGAAMSAGASGPPSIVTYTWDGKWDRPTRVVSAMGVVTRAAYDPASGLRTAQYVSDDDARFVRFGYDPATRLLTTVTTPLSQAPARYDYDALGNLYRSTSPIGFISTTTRDYLGRDSVVSSPIDSLQTQFRRQLLSYDIMDRLTTSVDTAPLLAIQGSLAQALHLTNDYDEEGNLRSVSRWSVPDTAHTDTLITDYTYDDAGRKLTEHDRYAPATQIVTWHYDPASNVRQIDPRGFQSVTMQYDTLNRMKQRSVPSTPNPYGSAADVSTFAYDAAGNMLSATNPWSKVARSYDLAGRVVGDTLWVKAADLTSPGMRHSYGLVNSYDFDGRRIAQRLPDNLSGNGQIGYTYDDQATGQLASVTDPQLNTFSYLYNPAGLLRTSIAPGNIVEVHEYDPDGRENHRSETSAFGLLHDDRYGRDARGNILGLNGQGSVASPSEWGGFGYSGLGAVLVSQLNVNDLESLHVRVDAFGNVIRKQQDGNELSPGLKIYTQAYEVHSNRLSTVSGQVPSGTDLLTSLYDASGNLYQQNYHQTTPGTVGETHPHVDASWGTVLTHDALGRMTVAQHSTVNDGIEWALETPHVRTVAAVALGYGSYEEYRYDALGRRIWKRTHRTPYCTATAKQDFPAECTSAVTVTVWDGSQVLYELRAAGGDELTSTALEQGIDVPSASQGLIGQFGTIAYVHGVGIDRPLEMIRNGAPMVLHASWRGMVDVATNVAGQVTTCGYAGAIAACDAVKWPGQESGLQFNRPRPVDVRLPWFGDMVQGHTDASGLMYKRNRYYDPNTGRFAQEDPIGLAGGMNLYGFAAGDPVNFSDPFGLCPAVLLLAGPVIGGATAVWCGAEAVALGATAAFVWFNNSRTSGETPATAGGREAHKTWDPGAGFQKEVRLPNGKRCDALNPETCEIKELKPDNERAKKRGEKQLQEYKKELEEQTGKEHKTTLETYKPKQP